MKLICLIGSNATGKSTRLTHVVDSLGEDYQPLFIDNKEVGRIYIEQRICIIGKRTGTRKWVSMDSFPLQNWESRLKFFKELKESNKVDILLIEGYFNMVAIAGRPPNWHEIGFETLHYYFFLYDTIDQFLERINERLNGKQKKNMEWAKTSPGWRDNNFRLKNGLADFYKTKSQQDTVERLDIYSDPYFFVDLLGLERVKSSIIENTLKNEPTNDYIDDF